MLDKTFKTKVETKEKNGEHRDRKGKYAGTWTTDVLTRQDKKPRRPWRKNKEKPDRHRDTTGKTGITKGTNINQGTEPET